MGDLFLKHGSIKQKPVRKNDCLAAASCVGEVNMGSIQVNVGHFLLKNSGIVVFDILSTGAKYRKLFHTFRKPLQASWRLRNSSQANLARTPMSRNGRGGTFDGLPRLSMSAIIGLSTPHAMSAASIPEIVPLVTPTAF